MRRNLEPGDIVRSPHDLGIVMRNDEDSGLLIAYPGNDELEVLNREAGHELTYLGNLAEIINKLGLR